MDQREIRRNFFKCFVRKLTSFAKNNYKLQVNNGEELVVREDFESTLLIEDGVPKLSEDFKKCLVKMKKPNHAKQEDITYKI